jgi:hypothetical protein
VRASRHAQGEFNADVIVCVFPVNCLPVEVKELLLATGEYTDVDCARRIDTHSLKRPMCDWRNDKSAVVLKPNEPTVE